MWATECNVLSVKGNILKPFAGDDVAAQPRAGDQAPNYLTCVAELVREYRVRWPRLTIR